MSPSRGFNVLLRARFNVCRPQTIRQFSNFVSAATNPENKSQIYISRCDDPYINLSIEHYLLQKTPTDSTVLFLYSNHPSIIIGRNQNPWNEVHQGLQRHGRYGLVPKLVRRRSGGGTVFHDEGNVNYSVICPTPAFDRNKHAQMVVRALQKLGVQKARVNERHDIVLDTTLERGGVSNLVERTFKISGSAYKLTRLRCLHHGTCLLSSPNLDAISEFLKSPLKPYLRAKGVDSVSSKITNVDLPNKPFEQAVVSEFQSMYGAEQPMVLSGAEKEVPEIAKGLDELMSNDWIYGQTPQFTFSTVDEAGESLLWAPPAEVTAKFSAKHGAITSIEMQIHTINGDTYDLNVESLIGKKIHEITSWKKAISGDASNLSFLIASAGDKLDSLFGNQTHGIRRNGDVEV